ncbi:hypothetical protein BRARA_B03442 [Brassica rapa]|uniref:Uncharacterized protein n=1 Tax=Brassica campestris TaxID=3711 RepID=A0A398AMB8_BRACM|nr:hypothetical protein BRARA_B03442 [Brassica rapa]
MFLDIRGNFLNCEHPLSLRIKRDSKLTSAGRNLRFEHFDMSSLDSLLSFPIEEGSVTKDVHPLSFNRNRLLRFPIEEGSANKDLHPRRFNFLTFIAFERSGISFKSAE